MPIFAADLEIGNVSNTYMAVFAVRVRAPAEALTTVLC